MTHYSNEDRARMKYYLAEMEDKYTLCPGSICLRNGIAEIRKRLGLPVTVTPINPMKELDTLTKDATAKLKLQTQLNSLELGQKIRKQFGISND